MNEKEYTAEQYKLALFGVIRNNTVMPDGVSQGMSMEEINKMSKETLFEVMQMFNFDRLREIYGE